MGLGIKRMGLKISRQNAAVAVGDIGPLRENRSRGRARLGLCRLGRGQNAHARAHNAECTEKHDGQQQKPPFGPHTRTVADLLMPDAQVFAFNRIGVLAGLARLKNAGQRTQGTADHGNVPSRRVTVSAPFSELTSTGLEMISSAGLGSGGKAT